MEDLINKLHQRIDAMNQEVKDSFREIVDTLKTQDDKLEFVRQKTELLENSIHKVRADAAADKDAYHMAPASPTEHAAQGDGLLPRPNSTVPRVDVICAAPTRCSTIVLDTGSNSTQVMTVSLPSREVFQAAAVPLEATPVSVSSPLAVMGHARFTPARCSTKCSGNHNNMMIPRFAPCVSPSTALLLANAHLNTMMQVRGCTGTEGDFELLLFETDCSLTTWVGCHTTGACLMMHDCNLINCFHHKKLWDPGGFHSSAWNCQWKMVLVKCKGRLGAVHPMEQWPPLNGTFLLACATQQEFMDTHSVMAVVSRLLIRVVMYNEVVLWSFLVPPNLTSEEYLYSRASPGNCHLWLMLWRTAGDRFFLLDLQGGLHKLNWLSKGKLSCSLAQFAISSTTATNLEMVTYLNSGRPPATDEHDCLASMQMGEQRYTSSSSSSSTFLAILNGRAKVQQHCTCMWAAIEAVQLLHKPGSSHHAIVWSNRPAWFDHRATAIEKLLVLLICHYQLVQGIGTGDWEIATWLMQLAPIQVGQSHVKTYANNIGALWMLFIFQRKILLHIIPSKVSVSLLRPWDPRVVQRRGLGSSRVLRGGNVTPHPCTGLGQEGMDLGPLVHGLATRHRPAEGYYKRQRQQRGRQRRNCSRPDRYVALYGEFSYDSTKWRPSVPFEDQLKALQELIDEGKVRYIGVSNETSYGVMKFVQAAKLQGLPKIVSIENGYSLLVRCSFEVDLIEVCHPNNCNVGLLAYSALGSGVLTGKYLDASSGNAKSFRLNLFPGYMQRYNSPLAQEATNEYIKVAKKHGLTPVQLALGFVRDRPFTASTIIGATTMGQLKENIDAFTSAPRPLPPQVVHDIETIFKRYRDPAVL